LLDLHDTVVPKDLGVLLMETGWDTQRAVGLDVVWPTPEPSSW
jgi:hypothetical protein